MNRLRLWWLKHGLLLMSVSAALGACTTPQPRVIHAPPVGVKVPVPVPCVPVQVPQPERPKARKGMNIFDLAKTVLADRLILVGDNVRLRAANANPCPGASQ